MPKPTLIWGDFSLGVELEKAVENPAGSEAKPERSRDPSMAGNVLARLGQLDEALAHFQKAIEINPDFADAQVELTRTLAAQGKKEDAEKHHQQALQPLKSQNRTPPLP
jgi:tetratricopeptide (TPR) repeat protein